MPTLPANPANLAAALRAAGVARGDGLALVVVGRVGLGLAAGRQRWAVPASDPAAVVAAVEAEIGPRWVWWSAKAVAPPVVAAGVRVGAGWDLAAVHRLLHGGRRDDPAAVWAASRALPWPPPNRRPVRAGQLDLLGAADDAEADGIATPADRPGGGADDADGPVRPDGQLRRDWAETDWLTVAPGARHAAAVLERAARWAAQALDVQASQADALRRLADPRVAATATPLAILTARAESAAELLACELEHEGLPVARAAAEALIGQLAGPRPDGGGLEDETTRRHRDEPVLALLPGPVDLRNPASVRTALRTVGIDVPDTRSGRLEPLRTAHPAVGALLTWRKAERIATTYGYRWLDTYVGADGRLRGAWQGSDGAGGRMTAQAGLHNLPADLRPAVVAEPGHVFVRADLGQIEPRVLAAVSGDPALARAAAEDDMYAPVAARLGCDRPTAKVAVLAAMYGQTSGTAGRALAQMRQAYPVALAYLDDADLAGQAGRDLRTFGGRLIRTAPPTGPLAGADRAAVAARGRYARNALVQGAAAELFKAWAATVRGALAPLGGSIVLCLHDELLLHVPDRHADEAVRLTHRTLAGTAGYWAAGARVRFVADVSTIRRWSDAKP